MLHDTMTRLSLGHWLLASSEKMVSPYNIINPGCPLRHRSILWLNQFISLSAVPCSTGLDPASEALYVFLYVRVIIKALSLVWFVVHSRDHLKKAAPLDLSLVVLCARQWKKGQSYGSFCLLFMQSKRCNLTAKGAVSGSWTTPVS